MHKILFERKFCWGVRYSETCPSTEDLLKTDTEECRRTPLAGSGILRAVFEGCGPKGTEDHLLGSPQHTESMSCLSAAQLPSLHEHPAPTSAISAGVPTDARPGYCQW